MKERLNVTTECQGEKKLPHLLAPNKKKNIKNIKPSIYVT